MGKGAFKIPRWEVLRDVDLFRRGDRCSLKQHVQSKPCFLFGLCIYFGQPEGLLMEITGV